MITLDGLKRLGAETEDGMARCLNKEDFYMKLVGMALEDEKFAMLRQAVEEKRLQEAFEYAHSLKGLLANVALTPVFEPVSAITEELRGGKETDYAPLLDEMDARRAEFLSLAD